MLQWKLEGAVQLEEDDSLSSIISDSLLQEARTILVSPLSHDYFSVLRFALAMPHSLPFSFLSQTLPFLSSTSFRTGPTHLIKKLFSPASPKPGAPFNPLLTPTLPAQRVWVAHHLFLWACSHTFEESIHSP